MCKFICVQDEFSYITAIQMINNRSTYFFTPDYWQKKKKRKQIACTGCHNLVRHYLHMKEHKEIVMSIVSSIGHIPPVCFQ